LLPLLALTLLAPAAAAAAPRRVAPPEAPRLPLRLHAGAAGELVEAPGASERAELLTFDEGLAAGLLLVRPDEAVEVAGWPVAPGAGLWEVGPPGMRPVPRSPLVFRWGSVRGDSDVRVMVSVDPESRELRGIALTPEGSHELQPVPRRIADAERQHLVGPRDF